jgi:hypothetical protein
MITRPTVLILGSGASAPYGFPTGPTLRDLICDGPHGGSSAVRSHLISAAYHETEIDRLIEALRGSGRQSVDTFLEHRPDLRKVGRAAIAAALIPYENPDLLFDSPRGNGRWYAYLFDQLDAPVSDWNRNALSIVTFNYDRSLEFFLRQALKHSFHLSPEDASTLAGSVPIIHLHGQLAPLGSDPINERLYERKPTNRDIKVAAKCIRIVCEASPDDAPFSQARTAIEAAERLYFLGFGFSIASLERLGNTVLRSPAELYGTCLGLAPGECQEIESWFGTGSIALRDSTVDILGLLRFHRPLNSRR